MHKIHITEGIVLNKRSVGEATNLVTLLTRDLGVIRANARSAREERSKLRFGLEPLTRGRFSLVEGKHEWRLTGVDDVSREFVAAHARHKLLGQVSKLILRLVQGEEPLSELYATVAEGFLYVIHAESQAEAEAIECVLVLRILSHLGYLPQRPELTPFVASALFNVEITAEAAKARSTLIRAINESLGATGL